MRTWRPALLDGWSEYFCQVAHARAEALQARNQDAP